MPKKAPAPFTWNPAPFVLPPLKLAPLTVEQLEEREAWYTAHLHKLLAGFTGPARLAKYHELLSEGVFTPWYGYIPE